MKEPKIRFNEFKGEWKEVTLGEIAPLIGGYAFQSANFEKTGIPIVRISNILDSGIVGGDFAKYKCFEGDILFRLYDGDTVIAMSGATTGKVAVVKTQTFLYQNQRVGKFSRTDKIYYPFVSIFVSSKKFTKELNKKLTASAQPNASSKDIDSVRLSFPSSKDEQQKIASFFTTLDAQISASTSRLASLKQIKAASLQAMFPQEGETVPKLRFKGFEGEWEKVTLSMILEERNEMSPKSEEYPLMAFIAYKGVAPKGERYDRSSLVKDVDNKLYKKTEYGDFIYSSNNLEIGSIGLNLYGNASISPVYSIFKSIKNVNYDFIGRRLICKDIINEMTKWRQGVVYGQWRIHEADFLSIQILLPSYEEQEIIGRYFANLDRQITLQSQRLEKLKQIKAACLDKMFV